VTVRETPSTVTFTLFYSEKNSNATLSECETIKRTVEQDLTVLLPSEILGLISNLSWSQTLSLRIEIEGKTHVNLRDAVVHDGQLQRRGSEPGHETSVHSQKKPFWKFWSWF